VLLWDPTQPRHRLPHHTTALPYYLSLLCCSVTHLTDASDVGQEVKEYLKAVLETGTAGDIAKFIKNAVPHLIRKETAENNKVSARIA
jgi:hypothetical protein